MFHEFALCGTEGNLLNLHAEAAVPYVAAAEKSL